MDALDLVPDLNSQDDDGFGWSTLADATAPERIRPGAIRLAGNRHGPGGGQDRRLRRMIGTQQLTRRRTQEDYR